MTARAPDVPQNRRMQIVRTADRPDNTRSSVRVQGTLARVRPPRRRGADLPASGEGVLCRFLSPPRHRRRHGRRRWLGRPVRVGPDRRRPTRRLRRSTEAIGYRPRSRPSRDHVEFHGRGRRRRLRQTWPGRTRVGGLDQPRRPPRRRPRRRAPSSHVEAPLPASAHGRIRDVDTSPTGCPSTRGSGRINAWVRPSWAPHHGR